jgi:hypothetical protein
VNRGGCFGSVLLDNELWQSLTSMNGRSVPWVHSCVLDHGHDGDHGAPAYHVDGEPKHWLRWPDTGPVRLAPVEPSPPGRHSKPLSLNPWIDDFGRSSAGFGELRWGVGTLARV